MTDDTRTQIPDPTDLMAVEEKMGCAYYQTCLSFYPGVLGCQDCEMFICLGAS